jgi:hypothetical protein
MLNAIAYGLDLTSTEFSFSTLQKISVKFYKIRILEFYLSEKKHNVEESTFDKN